MPHLRSEDRHIDPPWGFHEVDLAEESRIEDGLCENDAEAEMRLIEAAQSGLKQTTLNCGYCGDSKRFRVDQISAAIDWFRFHPCGVSTEATNPLAPERTPQSVAA